MSALQQLSDRWRYALLGGLVSLPFTTLSYARTGEELSLGAVFWAALAVGYLGKRRGLASSPIGSRAGVVGSLPVLWIAVDMAAFVLGLAGPASFRVVQLMFVGLILPLVVGLSAFCGLLGARLGGWLAERSGHPRSAVTGS